LYARVSAICLPLINIIGICFIATIASAIADYIFTDENRIGDGISLAELVNAPLAALLFWRCRKTVWPKQQS